MKNLNSKLFSLAIFSLLILFFIEALSHYDTTIRQMALALTDISGVIIILVVYFILKKKISIEIPWYVAWLAALGIWFDATGNFVHFYARFFWWDKLAHAVGSGAIALALFFIFYHLNKQGRIKLGGFNLCLYTISLTTFLSVLYEISEYIGDTIYPTNRVTGLFDTSDDLLWNISATILFVIFAYFLAKTRQKNRSG